MEGKFACYQFRNRINTYSHCVILVHFLFPSMEISSCRYMEDRLNKNYC